jgi:primosomal protein N' (replication factor Y) (superfamily II helicase)
VTVFAEVVFPLPIDRTFHYRIPPALGSRAAVGCRVVAPFGRRTMTGIIASLTDALPPGSFDVKDIREILDDSPSFPAAFLAFSRKLASRYFTPWGEVLQAALPPSLVPRERKKVALTPEGQLALEKGRLSGRDRELALLLKAGVRTPSSIAGKMGVGDPGPRIRKMEKAGLVTTHVIGRRLRRPAAGIPGKREKQLELEFDRTGRPNLAEVERRIGAGEFSSFYLLGPRAAREAAYARLVRRTLGAGRKVLFLTPEISLARDWIEKGIGGQGSAMAILHSRLPGKKREEEWRKIIEGGAEGAFGPRSVLLAPLTEVGLIVVDEESDESYDQPEGRLYETRGGAELRAEEEKAVLICGSSCPSVEAYHKALAGRSLVVLDPEPRRFITTVVDDRGHKGVFAAALEAKLRERLARGDQAILFVNRRGYSPGIFCSKCGHSPKCPHCDIALGYHKKTGQWVCHSCNSRLPASTFCPECGGPLVQKRARGIEAMEEELRRLFPRVTVARFDSDEAGREGEQDKVIEDFRRGRISALLATRLLVHRLDVPKVPFAAILSPETLLAMPDYGASQKVYQSITRMTGFVANDPDAEALIQTSNPSHFSIRAAAAGDFGQFYGSEIEIRRLMNYPPFTHLADIQLQGKDLRALARKSRDLAVRLKGLGGDVEVLGPGMAAVTRIRGQYRIQVILKSENRETLGAVLRKAFDKFRVKKTVRLS